MEWERESASVGNGSTESSQKKGEEEQAPRRSRGVVIFSVGTRSLAPQELQRKEERNVPIIILPLPCDFLFRPAILGCDGFEPLFSIFAFLSLSRAFEPDPAPTPRVEPDATAVKSRDAGWLGRMRVSV